MHLLICHAYLDLSMGSVEWVTKGKHCDQQQKSHQEVHALLSDVEPGHSTDKDVNRQSA